MMAIDNWKDTPFGLKNNAPIKKGATYAMLYSNIVTAFPFEGIGLTNE